MTSCVFRCLASSFGRRLYAICLAQSLICIFQAVREVRGEPLSDDLKTLISVQPAYEGL